MVTLAGDLSPPVETPNTPRVDTAVPHPVMALPGVLAQPPLLRVFSAMSTGSSLSN